MSREAARQVVVAAAAHSQGEMF